MFVIANLVNIGIGGVEQAQAQKTEKKVTSQLEKVLQTELVVDKNRLQFVSLHIYSKAPFKPTFLAQVEKFEIRIELAEAWSGGPFISKQISRSIEGKYGYFVKIKEFSTATISEIEKIVLTD